jgi:hypothetical protein
MPDLFHDLQVKGFINDEIKYSPNNFDIEKNIKV